MEKSSGHYRNLLSEKHVCGAIAYYKGIWVAIFYDKETSDFDNWRSYQIKKITIKRYDSVSGAYLSDSSIAYYEEGRKADTLEVEKIGSEEGKNLYLEIGKTYSVYERIAPNGYEKANSITFTVAADGPDEIILSN